MIAYCNQTRGTFGFPGFLFNERKNDVNAVFFICFAFFCVGLVKKMVG